MAKKAKSLYEVFVGTDEGSKTRTPSRPKGAKKSRTSSRKAPAGKSFGERRLDFSMSVNLLTGAVLVLVIFLAGAFAMGRYSVAGAKRAAIGGGERQALILEFTSVKGGESTRADVQTMLIKAMIWLEDNGIEGAFTRVSENGEEFQLIAPVPAAGLADLKARLLRLPPPDFMRNYRYTRDSLKKKRLITLR